MPVPLPLPEAPSPSPPPPPPTIHAPPTGTLRTVALTDDGLAAATIDDTSDVRLWPTLDGTREPVVVRGLAAAQIALGRDGDHLVLAELDAAGTLAIFRFTAAGDALGRAPIETDADATFDQIAMTARGILALRTDDVVELYAPWGHREVQLVPPAGERTTALVTAPGVALAMIDPVDAPTHRGRWIDLAGTPRWGDATPELAIDRAIAVSPDRRYLAARSGTATVVADLATGTIEKLDKPGEPLGFVGGDLVVQRGAVVQWLSPAGAVLAETAPDHSTTTTVDGGRVIGMFGSSLVMFDKARPRAFLGYAVLAAGPVTVRDGQLVGEGARFDAALDLVALAPVIPDRNPGWRDRVAIDEHHTLGLTADANNEGWLELRDDRTGETHPIQIDIYDGQIRFDAATGWLAATGAARVYFLHHDRDAAKLSEPLELELDHLDELGTIRSQFLDGARAIVIDQQAASARTWIVGLARDALIRAPMHRITGRIDAVDRSGLMFVSRGRDLALVRDGRELARYPGRAGAMIDPDLVDGGFAIRAGGAIAYYDATGTERWTIAAPLAGAIARLGDALVVNGGGLAKLDSRDGHVLACRTGWHFGLTAKPAPFGPAGPSACL